MKTLTNLIIFFVLLVVVSCTTPVSDNPKPSQNPEKGVVKGRVTDDRGNPVANAEIVASSTDWYNKTSTGYTDASGNYRIVLPAGIAEGSYSVSGTITTKYHNKNYTMALFEENNRVFSAYEGAVRNLIFRLTGKRTAADDETGLPLGATLEVHHDFNNIDPDHLEITMEPVGPLVDGNSGKKIVMMLPPNGGYIRDVAVGKYRITAKDKASGEMLGVAVHDSGNPLASSVTALFEPAQFAGSTFYELVIIVSRL